MSPNHPFVLNLPELSDEAVVALHHVLQDVLDRFESQYFAQMHRYDQDTEQARRQCLEARKSPPPLGDDPSL